MITPSGNSLNLTYCKDRRQALSRDAANLPHPADFTAKNIPESYANTKPGMAGIKVFGLFSVRQGGSIGRPRQ